ncbi:MAG: hypothetical protein KC474_02665 [Cyanobacteria bacterium HKST-UBA04]|nr:hypothetical protein [Cyanobacteria bacterium HKST-UBA04]
MNLFQSSVTAYTPYASNPYQPVTSTPANPKPPQKPAAFPMTASPSGDTDPMALFSSTTPQAADTLSPDTRLQMKLANLAIADAQFHDAAWKRIDRALSYQTMAGLAFTLNGFAKLYSDTEAWIETLVNTFGQDELPPAAAAMIGKAQRLLSSIVNLVGAVLPKSVSVEDIHLLLSDGRHNTSNRLDGSFGGSLGGSSSTPTGTGPLNQLAETTATPASNMQQKEKGADGFRTLIATLVNTAHRLMDQADQDIRLSSGYQLSIEAILTQAEQVAVFLATMQTDGMEGQLVGQAQARLARLGSPNR